MSEICLTITLDLKKKNFRKKYKKLFCKLFNKYKVKYYKIVTKSSICFKRVYIKSSFQPNHYLTPSATDSLVTVIRYLVWLDLLETIFDLLSVPI